MKTDEHDACALYAWIAKDAQPAHEPIPTAIEALEQMLHRAGSVDGEGDGCGVLLDIPRELWSEEVRRGGHISKLALDPNFTVLHLFIPRAADPEDVKARARELLSKSGLRILAERHDVVESSALGPTAREEEPRFWQIGGVIDDPRLTFELKIRLESELDTHVASCSTDTVVYKALGGPLALGGYFPDLLDPRAKTTAVFGHNRYSTKTWPALRRVQPFGVLGHNGEINTITRLRQEAKMIGVPLGERTSDSEDLNRTVESLISRGGLTLVEALELTLPPIVNEIKGMPEELRGFYMYLRQAFGPFAQGPVALVSRHGDECVFCVDALGLRPLWHLETSEAHVFSSEPGVVPVADTIGDPKPFAPGEKLVVHIDRAKGESRLLDHHRLQRLCCDRWRERTGGGAHDAGFQRALPVGGPLEGDEIPGYSSAGPAEPVRVESRVLGGFGWQREDMRLVQQMANTGAEPISSLGYDGPLAALSPERQNLADFFKESVAVVTNPAIDREREVEHFSCRAVMGPRPGLHTVPDDVYTVETAFPVILGGHHELAPLSDESYRKIAREHKTYLLEDLWEEFRGRAKVLDCACLDSESTSGVVERLKHEATGAVRDGARLLVIDDRTAYDGGRRYLDPHLALAAVDLALREHWTASDEPNLRRRCGLVLRTAAVRNVHDLALALGLGADGVCPYTMIEVALLDDYAAAIDNLATALRKGIEKVISTIGIHEVRGYARLFSSIGLKPEITKVFDTTGYAGTRHGGTGFTQLDLDGDQRQRVLAGEEDSKPAKTFRFYPKVYKAAVAAAAGNGDYSEFSERVRGLELEQPIALRHLLDVRSDRDPISAESVDPGVGLHSYPIFIAPMSFGSQGEIAYRAYAEGAKRADIIAMNGEGGELPDMYGRYPQWRGQQVSGGRFGVTGEMLNSSYLVEIKVGQGAKPGEGGHLPAKKVTDAIARARNATGAVDLISPSSNHDLYSIEDLAELIDELKTANPDARVSVRVPVVPNIGTIAVGIAKAGADMITLSGFDGGTGAARAHALRHVGLPADIGTRAVHVALMEAGIRNRVEIWADGGLRHAHDIVKLHCLGANRVGFGTLAMVALGCTICRGCQLDTCHVGIATQIANREEAELKGLKKFTPQELESASANCARFFTAMGEELRELTASLGFERTQDLVGRTDLLVQARGHRPGGRGRADQAGRGDARPRAPGPAGATGRARGPRPGAQPPARHEAQGAGGRSRPRGRGGGRARAAAHRRHGARGQRGHAGRAASRGGLGGRPGPRRLQRLRHRHHRRGRRPGRGGQGDAGRQDRGAEGHQPAWPAGKRLGGQGVRLRRPAGAAVRAGRRRLALRGSAERGRRGGRRRAGGAARRLARVPGRSRQPEGVRLRVHDRRPRGGAGRPRPVDVRRPDRRAGVPARQPRVEPRPRGAGAPRRATARRCRSPSSTPRGCSTSRSCWGGTPTSCRPPGRTTRPSGSTGWRRSRGRTS